MSGSIVDPDAASHPVLPVPPTPDRVTWAEVRAKTKFPPGWELVGNPRPIPGGALIITRFVAKRVHRTMCQVLSWNMETGQLDVLTENGVRAIFTKADDARNVAEDVARRLREAAAQKP